MQGCPCPGFTETLPVACTYCGHWSERHDAGLPGVCLVEGCDCRMFTSAPPADDWSERAAAREEPLRDDRPYTSGLIRDPRLSTVTSAALLDEVSARMVLDHAFSPYAVRRGIDSVTGPLEYEEHRCGGCGHALAWHWSSVSRCSVCDVLSIFAGQDVCPRYVTAPVEEPVDEPEVSTEGWGYEGPVEDVTIAEASSPGTWSDAVAAPRDPKWSRDHALRLAMDAGLQYVPHTGSVAAAFTGSGSTVRADVGVLLDAARQIAAYLNGDDETPDPGDTDG